MHASGNQDRHRSRVGRIKEQIIVLDLSLVPSLPDLCSTHARKNNNKDWGNWGRGKDSLINASLAREAEHMVYSE